MSPSAALRLLGLEPYADERSIRRAYARRLKRIDLGHDPDAFQELRLAYEVALRYETQARDEGDSSTDGFKSSDLTVTSPATDSAPEPGETGAPLAEHIELVESLRLRLANGVSGESQALILLDEALADPRLAHLDSQLCFERLLAEFLCQGWQPGNELLFQAACHRFEWQSDKRGLRRLAPAGDLIDLAITQGLSFFDQPATTAQRQAKLIERLRRPETPTKQWLREELMVLELMMERYGFWLQLIAPAERVQAWRKIYETEMGGPPRAAVRNDAVPEGRASSIFQILGGLLLCVWWLSHCGGALDPSTQRSGLAPAQASPLLV